MKKKNRKNESIQKEKKKRTGNLVVKILASVTGNFFSKCSRKRRLERCFGSCLTINRDDDVSIPAPLFVPLFSAISAGVKFEEVYFLFHFHFYFIFFCF